MLEYSLYQILREAPAIADKPMQFIEVIGNAQAMVAGKAGTINIRAAYKRGSFKAPVDTNSPMVKNALIQIGLEHRLVVNFDVKQMLAQYCAGGIGAEGLASAAYFYQQGDKLPSAVIVGQHKLFLVHHNLIDKKEGDDRPALYRQLQDLEAAIKGTETSHADLTSEVLPVRMKSVRITERQERIQLPGHMADLLGIGQLAVTVVSVPEGEPGETSLLVMNREFYDILLQNASSLEERKRRHGHTRFIWLNSGNRLYVPKAIRPPWCSFQSRVNVGVYDADGGRYILEITQGKEGKIIPLPSREAMLPYTLHGS